MNPLPISARHVKNTGIASRLLCDSLAGLLAFGCVLSSLGAADFYVLPQAKGSGDGASWENAAAAPAADAWTARIAQLAAGDTLHIGSGTYAGIRFSIAKGGTGDLPVTLLGEDTGAGLPIFRGSWTKEKPASGEILCSFGPGASFVTLKNLRVQNHLAAVVTSGGNDGLVISGLDIRDVRMGAVFKGNARADNPATWTRNVLVENCTFTGFTKSALRWEGGNRDFRIVNCHGDAGGKPYFTEPFHMIYDIRGDGRKDLPEIIERVHDRNLTFENCTAHNAYHQPPSGKNYWNGDGFVAERGVKNLTFVNCAAFDCTDGGWDLKADNVTFKNCVSFRNKRNFRIWGTATFENCIAGFPQKRGGSGGAANLGIYSKEAITLDHCTLVTDGSWFNIESKDAKPDDILIRLKNSLLVSIDKDVSAADLGKQVALTNTALINLARPAKGPVFKTPPAAEWDGKGAAFDPQPAYAGQGYRSAGDGK
ncbi:hypothetical protein OpiT1DRAFT_03148 [Opitutaceae bacterium TAV1]|nr:hypothetical protein OpiT1DRAFT_03148 [Opitutaceae bacterium TAV1]